MTDAALLLEELSNAYGAPAFEDEVADIVARELAPIADVSHDRLGSVVARMKGRASGPAVALFAHMDEVAFMVGEVAEDGFVKMRSLGGWWTHVLLGQRVVVRSRTGDHLGVVRVKWDPEKKKWPDDYKKTVEFDEMYVDVGVAAGFDAGTLGIRPGDPILPTSRFTRLANPDLAMGKAFDDRLGVAAMISVMHALASEGSPNRPIAVATVREEVGLIGAATSVWVVDPDVAIILETSYASDSPGPSGNPGRKVGKGPFINLADRTMIGCPRLRELVIRTAEELEIPLQFPTSETSGTDGGRVHLSRAGVPTVYCGVVARGIHGHNAVASLSDVERAVKLFTAVVRRLDADAVSEITKRT